MVTYCKDCKHVLKQRRDWLCGDTGRASCLGVPIYLTCVQVNDDTTCSRFKPKWLYKLLKRIKK